MSGLLKAGYDIMFSYMLENLKINFMVLDLVFFNFGLVYHSFFSVAITFVLPPPNFLHNLASLLFLPLIIAPALFSFSSILSPYNFSFFPLPSPTWSSQLDLKEGDIVENAVVFESRPAGISLKLNDKYRGYCFLKDLPYGHQNPRNVKKAFPVGHKSECSIIRYCYMDRMFIVSLQKVS